MKQLEKNVKTNSIMTSQMKTICELKGFNVCLNYIIDGTHETTGYWSMKISNDELT